MSELFHIISTRSIHVDAVGQLKQIGCKITMHDFVRKRIEFDPKTTLTKDVVLTSPTGVQAFLEMIKELKLSPGDYQVHCIDQLTKQTATQAGLTVKASAPNARMLAEEILKHSEIRLVTHICGNRRRDELSQQLKLRGVEVKDVVAYYTEFASLAVREDYDGIFFFSPGAIDSFLILNGVKQVVCFCIGHTTETHAKQKGFLQTSIPKVSSEKALVSLAIEYLTTTIHDKK